jgi:dienelactone hydrolase
MVAVFPKQSAVAQMYGERDRGQPGDWMIQTYMAGLASQLDSQFVQDLQAAAKLPVHQERWRSEFLDMLGIDDPASRTDLLAQTTGALEEADFVVEKLHFQSRPGLYVTGNLFRPKATKPGERLPAILYVCGHSGMGRNGNKTAFQSHGIWFAKHGYVCLVIDTLQLGEIAAKHHGTYNLGRWWWHSRGYTSAGVECWNGIRAIDYLQTRSDVDPTRIGVTGISGGGAATFWIAAADPRVTVVVPVSGMADLQSYVGNLVINGHCDCMFLYNHHQWPWSRIALLVAPRPMLFVNSDADAIFPMDANERISNRMERLYSLFRAGDRFETQVSVGGHAYREDIRRGVFQFMNAHLCNQARPVTDANADVQLDKNEREQPYLAPEKLRVFATDQDIPADERNTTIDQHFVVVASPVDSAILADRESRNQWRSDRLVKLRQRSFRNLPESVPAASLLETISARSWRLSSEPEIWHAVRLLEDHVNGSRVVLVIDDEEAEAANGTRAWWRTHVRESDIVYQCLPRGTGPTAWTRKNPPNYVERSHVLLGTTVDAGRVRDVIATARWLRTRHAAAGPIHLLGRKAQAVLAAYAGLFEQADIGGLSAIDPMTSHMDSAAPQFLSVLRNCDIPQAFGLWYPRKLYLQTTDPQAFQPTRDIYGSDQAHLVIGH